MKRECKYAMGDYLRDEDGRHKTNWIMYYYPITRMFEIFWEWEIRGLRGRISHLEEKMKEMEK